MPTLRPFRDYDEKDVINIFAYSGALPVSKGTLVKIVGSGFRPDLEPIEMLGNMGDFSVPNTVLQRYGVVPKVTVCGTGDDNPIGMLLFDVRETDENGELLKYRPRKAAEMEAILSGQAVPIVTRGTFQYSGVPGIVAISPGATAYAGSAGLIVQTGTIKVGRFLGTTGTDGSCVVWLNCLQS